MDNASPRPLIPQQRTPWPPLLLLLAAATVFPVAALLVGAVAIDMRRRAARFPRTVLVMVAVLTWMNVERGRDNGDIVWYLDYFHLVANSGLLSVFDISNEILVHAKTSEFAYYALSWIIAKLSWGSESVYCAVISLLIYGMSCLGLLKISRRVGLSGPQTAALLLLASLACITFTLTNHLIRQELAGAYALGALGLHLDGRRRAALALALIAVLTHNSVVVPIAFFVGVEQFVVRRPRRLRHLLPITVAAGVIAGFVLTRVVSSESPDIYEISDGAVSKLVVAYDVALALVTSLCMARLGRRGRLREDVRRMALVLTVFYVAYLSFCAVLPPGSLPALRFYFYLDFIRWIAPLVLFLTFRRRLDGPALILLALLVGVAYVNLRVARSPFDYGGDLLSYLAASPIPGL